MLAFGGTCLAHRAEILQLRGAWREALEAAQRASEQRGHGVEQTAVAAGYYQQAEVRRLRGELAEAEEKYKSANEWGMEPQPGLALLRVAQGRSDAAAAAIRRVLGATTDGARRTRLLPAAVEILLAAGDVKEAGAACEELEAVAQRLGASVLDGLASQARGAVQLAEGDAAAALISLRRAGEVWQQVEAPYLAARVRGLVGLACCALGDEDGGQLELDAARATFEQLGAAPDVARIDALAKSAPSGQSHHLTGRELQVLRMVASGKTNKAIAKELGLSEKTVDRHVSNIFTKLDVPSRAAATAEAYKLGLVGG
jgi:ATP/maltotriose-dependent transcriptional regulator MalT